MFRTKPRANPWAAMLLLVIIGSVTVFMIVTRSAPWSDSGAGKKPEPPPSTARAAPVVEKGPSPVGIGPGARVLYRTRYSTCGHVITSEAQGVPGEMVNLTAEQLRMAYPDWTIEDFQSDRVVLSATRDGLCPDMQRYRYIGVQEGKVTVFYGKPGQGELVKAVTSIEASRLSPADLEALKKGIVADGDGDVAAYLEGVGDD